MGNLNVSSVRVATLAKYKYVTECVMKDTFDGIVGQGWNIDKYGCTERSSCDEDHNPLNEVANFVLNSPPASDKYPQYIVNVLHQAKSCKYAPLNPTDVSSSIDTAAPDDVVEIQLPDGDRPTKFDPEARAIPTPGPDASSHLRATRPPLW